MPYVISRAYGIVQRQRQKVAFLESMVALLNEIRFASIVHQEDHFRTRIRVRFALS